MKLPKLKFPLYILRSKTEIIEASHDKSLLPEAAKGEEVVKVWVEV